MPSSLPYLCLREIFEFILYDPELQWHQNNLNNLNLSNLLPSISVCKAWCETALPILWRDPFCNHPQEDNATILLDVYLSSFTLEELYRLNLPSKLIEIYQKRRPTYDYARFLRKMDLTQIKTVTSFWLESKRDKVKISNDCPIFQSICSHFVSHAINIKYAAFEPEYDSLIDFNLFSLPGAISSLSNLSEFSCYGESYNISLYKQASEISTKVHDLKISLIHGCPLNSSTLIDISNYIRSQRQLERFSIDNRIGCYCCSQDQDHSLSLDLTTVFKSLSTQTTTLTHLSFLSIDFHQKFLFNQLSQSKNLKALNITRCWNFGEVHSIDLTSDSFTRLSDLRIILSSIPENVIRILLTGSGSCLRNLEFEQFGIITDILKYCSDNNPNLVNVLVYIDPKEIVNLPKFLRSSTKLCNLELWDKNTPDGRRFSELYYLMRFVETIDLDEEMFSEIGDSLPNSLVNLKINMKWNFSAKSLERFIKNCKAPLDSLGFEFCNCFDDEHFQVLVKNLKRPLKNLNIKHCRANVDSEIRTKNRDMIQQIDSLSRRKMM
ncbi:2095_t:CDS:1 [Funneliformis mosseae]|uniref:2095_t:CDS:1 n=1 Tax=Funneliformis mosseae TaxID=27381 RepID=A0A9N9ALJ3_FUNMO|nr:2095_t:CDS:1 [Funneliformis mosseae]